MDFAQLVALATHPMLYWIAAALIGGIAVVRGRHRNALIIAGAAIGSALTVELLKRLTDVARPENGLVEAAGTSFPSGHAAGAAFLAAALFAAITAPRALKRFDLWLALALALPALLIGLSRLYLGVHRPFEVAVGFAVGLLWGGLVIAYLRIRTT